jgi:hypothetical protein
MHSSPSVPGGTASPTPGRSLSLRSGEAPGRPSPPCPRACRPSGSMGPRHADDLGLESPVPVTGHVGLDRGHLGHHRLRSLPVPRIRRRSASGVQLRVAEVLIELALERGLQHPLGLANEQTAGPSQRDPLGLGLVHQPFGEPASSNGPCFESVTDPAFRQATAHQLRSGSYTVRSTVLKRSRPRRR